MYNIKLVGTKNEKTIKTEYFTGEMPARFLNSINNINIIVGANNSRKSRFIRHVIQQENPVLIETQTDLNFLYNEGLSIIENIGKLKKSGFNKTIITATYLNQDRREIVILKNYYETRRNRDTGINGEDLIALVDLILEKINSATSSKHSDAISVTVQLLTTVLEFISYLYNHFENKGGNYTHSLAYPDSPFKQIGPAIPDLAIHQPVPFLTEIIKIVKSTIQWCRSLQTIKLEEHTGKNIYIPALRTSRKLFGVDTDVFEETIRRQHFRDTKIESLEIHTGLKLYERINLARNGDKAERDAFSEFEKFIGSTFFNTDAIHIIPYISRQEDEDGIKVTIPGQKSDVPIYDLGEGVQGIINLLFPIFTANEGDWIFIDEPENHLHPGFQNIFVKTISENEYLLDKKLRFFINTHSNHILSETFLSNSGTTTFIFSRKDENSSNIKVFEQDHFNILELLGVMSTSVFTTNCTIWVEGITDRFYIRAFLQAFLKTIDIDAYHPNEGFDFSFIEYAGKNLLHYNFDAGIDENISAFFINSKVFVLADTDFDLRKHIKYQKIDRKNFTYVQTKVPEIENLLPESIIKKFLLEELKCDNNSVKGISFSGRNEKLGKMLNGVTKKGRILKLEALHGGTLSAYYKSKLSKYVFDQINSGKVNWDTLSTSYQLQHIVNKLYKFIKNSNKR